MKLPSLFANKPDAEQIKQNVLEAARKNDWSSFANLCKAHQDVIHANFSEWTKVPQHLRSDPAALQQYVEALIAVAQYFASSLGKPELLQRLMQRDANPLDEWQSDLQAARKQMQELRYEEAIHRLLEVLKKTQGLQGTGVDSFLPITHGFLGECYFHTGKVSQSFEPYEIALSLCQQHGDTEGIIAYLQNLFEAHRYQGNSEKAADTAEQLAQVFEKHGQNLPAARFRKRASIVRDGEPLNRIIIEIDGNHFELDELHLIKGQQIRFVFERNRIALRPSSYFTASGEKLGSEGQYDQALSMFQQASQADPLNPHPRFLSGFTLLHLGQYAEAVAAYETAEQLAPGWFSCRADLWIARQLVSGKMDQELFQLLHLLQDSPLEPEHKIRLAMAGLERAPQAAPFYLYLGECLQESGESEAAETAFRDGLACADDEDTKTRLLLSLGLIMPSAEERRQLLREAQTLCGNLTSAAMATVALHHEKAV